MNQGLNENSEKVGSQPLVQKYLSMGFFTEVDDTSSRRNKRLEFNGSRVSPLPNGAILWSAPDISKSVSPVIRPSKKFFSASLPGSRIVSCATSRHSSPPCTTTQSAAVVRLGSPNHILEDAKRVEELTRKTQIQEVELLRTTEQLKEAISVAGEETAKAAKEVIKSLTAQLKEVALQAVRNSKSPVPVSPGFMACTDAFNICMEPFGTSTSSHESGIDFPNGHVDREANQGSAWVEQDEPGVYIALVSLPEGVKDLKQVRFSRRHFSEEEAAQWWAANRARIYQQYNVPMRQKRSSAHNAQRNKNCEDRSLSSPPLVENFPSKELVVGQVKILKPRLPPTPTKKKIDGGEDLLLCSTNPSSPDPDVVQKQTRMSDLYAGSAAFLSSLPPSSLPFPVELVRSGIVTSDLRRMLKI
ncbi:hypothetical protein Ancab_034275 [Ancistrocladus abbreviatus]